MICSTALFALCGLGAILLLPGVVRADTITSIDFEAAGGYTTWHSGTPRVEFSGDPEAANDVFARTNLADSNWTASTGADFEGRGGGGTYCFGWRDPEGTDIGTSDPFNVQTDSINVSAYNNIQVSLYWRSVERSAGAFEVSDFLRAYVIEDSIQQADFLNVIGGDGEAPLNTSAAYVEVTFMVQNETNFIEIYVEGLTNGGTECLGIDDIVVTGDPATAVELTSFTGTDLGASVLLEWGTASEIDNAGFHLWRAEAEDGDFEPITELVIPAQGGPTWGSDYSFEDDLVMPGRTYLYKLEDIAVSGHSTMHGPIAVDVLFQAWSVADEADAATVRSTSARGVNVFAALALPLGAILFWLRRQRRRSR